MRDYEPDNLDLDSKRALELGYGVHYGHYKADYPNTAGQEIPEDPKMGKCEWCGAQFQKTRKDKRFCCDWCSKKNQDKQRSLRAQKSARARLDNCLICGAPVKGRMLHYCSIECSMEANRRRSLEHGKALRERRKEKEDT